MNIITTRRNGEGAEGELSVMIESKEAYNTPECTHTNVKFCRIAQGESYALDFCRKQGQDKVKKTMS